MVGAARTVTDASRGKRDECDQMHNDGVVVLVLLALAVWLVFPELLFLVVRPLLRANGDLSEQDEVPTNRARHLRPLPVPRAAEDEARTASSVTRP